MHLIYIAGPYSSYQDADGHAHLTPENVHKAAWAGIHLMLQGYAVHIPHKNTEGMEDMHVDCNHKLFLQNDYEILSRCNAIYMLKDWEWSPGARSELAFVEALNRDKGIRIAIAFQGANELPDLNAHPALSLKPALDGRRVAELAQKRWGFRKQPRLP